MHRPGECRAHRVCIFVCNLVGFILVNPFSLVLAGTSSISLCPTARFSCFSFSLSSAHSLLSPDPPLSFPRSLVAFPPASHRLFSFLLLSLSFFFSPFVSCSLLRFLTLLDDVYTVSSYSLLTFPARLQASLPPASSSSLLHTLTLRPTTLLVAFPFRTFTFAQGKPYSLSLPYPENNPRRSISYDLYTYVSEGGREGTEGNRVCSYEAANRGRADYYCPPLLVVGIASSFPSSLCHENWRGLRRNVKHLADAKLRVRACMRLQPFT